MFNSLTSYPLPLCNGHFYNFLAVSIPILCSLNTLLIKSTYKFRNSWREYRNIPKYFTSDACLESIKESHKSNLEDKSEKVRFLKLFISSKIGVFLRSCVLIMFQRNDVRFFFKKKWREVFFGGIFVTMKCMQIFLFSATFYI